MARNPWDNLSTCGRLPSGNLAWSDPLAPSLECFDLAIDPAELAEAVAWITSLNATLKPPKIDERAARNRQRNPK